MRTFLDIERPAGIWYISLITISCIECMGIEVKSIIIISVHKRCDCFILFYFIFKVTFKRMHKNIVPKYLHRCASVLCFDTQQIYTENNLFVQLG